MFMLIPGTTSELNPLSVLCVFYTTPRFMSWLLFHTALHCEIFYFEEKVLQ